MKEKKYEMLERRTREIISEYTIRLTIRQVYYRLVANNDIPSNRSQYVYFDKVLTTARQKDLELAAYFEDKTRKIIDNSEIIYPYWKYSEYISQQLEKVKTDYPQFTYNSNLLQDTIVFILVEKQALEGVFEQALRNTNIFVVSRGLNSFSQMLELRELIKDDSRKVVAYIFTDFDDSGFLIQDNFLNQMKKYLKIDFDYTERIALEKEQIEKYHLPLNPTKHSTHSKYNLPYFVELDSLDPTILMDLVREVCDKHFNQDLYNAIKKALDIRNRRLKKAYFRKLKKIDLSKI